MTRQDEYSQRAQQIKVSFTPKDAKDAEESYPAMIANSILLNDNFITTVDTQEIYRWNKQYWEKNAEAYIREQCKILMKENLTRYYVSEVIANIKYGTYMNREDLETPKHLLNLKNGILNLNTSKLENFEESIYFRSQLPIDFASGIDCPSFKKFLGEVLHPEDIPVIQELFGYCLWKNYHIHKAFVLIGPGRNGKTTLLRVLQALLGKENCTNLTLQRIEYSDFAPGRLYGKLANISLELPTTKLTHATTFKGLTGQDIVDTDVKHKDGFSFLNFAKLIFACNNLPPTEDDTDAFHDRFVIIRFPNQFFGAKADKKLLEKLITPEEITGIFNWALKGLERLLETGEFSYDIDLEEIRTLYERLSEPTVAFYEDVVIEVQDRQLFRQDALFAYHQYCQEKRLPPDGKVKFYEKLRSCLGREKRDKIGDRREYWQGYALREEYQEIPKIDKTSSSEKQGTLG